MENLNKENFWNELMAKYPNAVKHFCDWIDDYKKEVQWNDLFGNNTLGRSIKFHDLPIEMQNGIMARYELELFANQDGKGLEIYKKSNEAFRHHLCNLFKDQQERMDKVKRTWN